MDETGRRLSARRLPEGLSGIGQLHALIAEHAEEPDQVVVGIETDRGLWVAALDAADYQVVAVNPLAVARYRDRHHVSGAKSDASDAKLRWPIWCAPIGTTIAASPETAPKPRRSRCSPEPIKT
jgi:Transposase